MGWIRIGYFENFGDKHTLLIAGDAEGFGSMTEVFRELSVGRDRPIDVGSIARVTVCGAIRVVLETSSKDEGLLKRAPAQYAWRRSPAGWTDLAAKLATLTQASAAHHYLDGPADDVQVVAAIGEYGKDWSGWSAG